MRFLVFARIMASEYYNIASILKDYSSDDINSKFPALKKANSLEGYKPKDYARKHHGMHDTNKATRICQKGLEERIRNKKIKEEMAENEKIIQEAFSKKIKSRRWAKRHHDYSLAPDRYFPQKHLFTRRNYIA